MILHVHSRVMGRRSLSVLKFRPHDTFNSILNYPHTRSLSNKVTIKQNPNQPRSLSNKITINPDNHHTTGEMTRPKIKKPENITAKAIEILSSDLIIKGEHLRVLTNSHLGAGQFSTVYEAIWTKNYNQFKVAAKVFKNTEDEEFLQEIKHLQKINGHQRCLTLLGICMEYYKTDTKKPSPVVIMPLMKNGSVQNCLKQYAIPFTVGQLLVFMHQMLEGLKYLHDLNIIHGDLATRNLLLNEDMEVVISDFGLSVDAYEKVYAKAAYNKVKAISDADGMLPLRWLPPEIQHTRRLDVHTDIWAAGIVWWELFTRSAVPYVEDVDWSKNLHKGFRLARPLQASTAIY